MDNLTFSLQGNKYNSRSNRWSVCLYVCPIFLYVCVCVRVSVYFVCVHYQVLCKLLLFVLNKIIKQISCLDTIGNTQHTKVITL